MSDKRLLVVDDNPEIHDMLESYFSAKGYEVRCYVSGTEALDQFAGYEPDVAILDVNMPEIDGLTLCREIRRQSALPIIMLSAEDSEADKVVGLEVGASDYVTKPFSLRELEARIKAQLRLAEALSGGPSPELPERGDRLRFGDWILDRSRRELSDADGRVEPLTGAEYRLLNALVEHPNRVLSRDQLMTYTRGYEAGPFDRSIDVQIGRLRKKLGDSGPDYELIRTFRGEGYMLVAKVARA